MWRQLEPAPIVGLAGSRVRSATTVASVGAYHLALATVLPDRGVELETFYTGHEQLGESHVTHLLLAPGSRALRAEPLTQSEVPVVWARRRCLYDHLQRLGDFLRELGYARVQIDIGDEALAGVEAS
jgi:hypothetical protein